MSWGTKNATREQSLILRSLSEWEQAKLPLKWTNRVPTDSQVEGYISKYDDLTVHCHGGELWFTGKERGGDRETLNTKAHSFGAQFID